MSPFGALPGKPFDPVRRALSGSRSLFVAAFGFSAVMSILALTTSFYMLQVYDRVLSSRSVETLLLLTIIAAGALSVFSVLDSLRLRLLQRTGMRVGAALSPDVLRAMIATASQTGGSTMRSGLRDVDSIRNFIGSPGFAALMDAPFVVFYLIVLGLLHPFFLIIVVVGGAILIGIAAANQNATNAPLSQALSLAAKTHEFAEDGVRNADVLEGMGMSAGFATRWRRAWVESLQQNVSAVDRDSRYSSLSRGVRLFMQVLLLGTGALLILDFQATGGIMIGASIIGARALQPVETLVSTWKSVIATRLAWERIVMLLERAPKRDEGMKLPAPQGHLQAVSVQYVTPQRLAVLANVSFEIKPGETLGIIGPSGSGKSTLLRLLIGAWPCSNGVVRLDGADIYAWPRAELSAHIGYLPQDVELFAGTVRENIARMTEGAPDDVVRAAKRARVHEMILELPKGYDTDIGAGGHKLSGGQSQRIAITRALFGNPRYLVLDEPNSNLDAAGDKALLESLAELKGQGVTIVIVAHRPSILATADKMLVLRANGTVEAFDSIDKVLPQYTGAPRAATNVVKLSGNPTTDGRRPT